jgi:hypothetical protein
MNKFISLLLLVVALAAMLLVFLVHTNNQTENGGGPVNVLSTPAPPATPAAPQEAAPAQPATPPAPPAPEPAISAPSPDQIQNIRPEPAATPASPAPIPVRPAPDPTASVPASPSAQGSLRDISLHFKDGGMILRLEGDVPLSARYFILSAPERLVLDISGNWKGIKVPAMPSNNIIKAIRLGRHGNADRLVLDLLGPLRAHNLERLNENKMELYFQR